MKSQLNNIKNSLPKAKIAIIMFITLGFFLRTVWLDKYPPGFNGDAANPLALMNEGKINVWSSYFSIESVQYSIVNHWINLLWLKIMPFSVSNFRLLYALTGSATLLIFYLWLKEYTNRNIAILSTLLLAISQWHVHISRTAPYGGNSFVVFFIVSFLYFIEKGIKKDRHIYYILATITAVVGLKWYYYSKIILVYYLFIVTYKYFNKSVSKKLLIYFTIFLVIAASDIMMVTSGFESARLEEVTYIGKTNAFNTITTFLRNYFKTAIDMLYIKGEQSWQYNYPGKPLLEIATMIFLPIGIILSAKNYKKQPYSLLLFGFLIFPVISAASFDSPQSNRSMIGIPFIYALAGIGLEKVWNFKMKNYREIARFLIAAIIVISLITSIRLYLEYSSQESTVRTFMQPELEFAERILNSNEKFLVKDAGARTYGIHNYIKIYEAEPENVIFFKDITEIDNFENSKVVLFGTTDISSCVEANLIYNIGTNVVGDYLPSWQTYYIIDGNSISMPLISILQNECENVIW